MTMSAPGSGFHRVDELPDRFRAVFPKFKLFNAVQSDCFNHSYMSDQNMVIAAPTGSGKTVVLELAMLRLFMRHMRSDGEWILQQGRHKCIYVAPNKSLVQERVSDWNARMAHLHLQIVECTGDSENIESPDLGTADIIATTPEKLDALSRRFFDCANGGMSFISDVALLLVDEVHMLSEDRGPTLEAGVVCRLRTLGSMRELATTNLSSMRILAASATIPNVHDIARWLSVQKDGCKIFGDEMRPVNIRTFVKGFPAAKNDFMFERWLSDKVFSIVQEHWQSKPVLTFCASRKGTVECANQVRKASMRVNTRTTSFFVRNEAQKTRLLTAAQSTQDKALADMLVHGVAWHNASMEPADRSLVEQLFIARDVMFLACTATLAQGVNLPAYLVIVKGTQRYCSDGGKGRACQYREYEMGECLQMIGRAGRPQFESSAVAVFMTKAENAHRYQNLAQGRAPIESQLHNSLAEFLNAAIAQRVVCSVTQAYAWLQSTYLWQRLFINPAAYGVVMPRSTPEALASHAKHLFINISLQRLASSGLIRITQDAITPLDPGSLMCKFSIQLGTMALVHSAPGATSMRDLLQIVCSASENSDIPLRRSEKKVLNDLNSQAHAQEQSSPGSAFAVLEDIDSHKKKQRVSESWEKSFVLVNHCLMSGGDFAPSVDFSMRQDANKVIQSGKRIVQCMIRYYEFEKRFAAIAASIRLHRALVQRMWDASPVTCRQLPGIGKLLGEKLLEAGLGDIASISQADPRHIEKVTNKVYPWGDQRRDDSRRLLPPQCQLNVDLHGTTGSRFMVNISLEITHTPGQTRRSFSWLVVGSLHDDRLLAAKHIDLNACPSPFQMTVGLMTKPVKGEQVRVVVAVMSATIIGRDCIKPVSIDTAELVAHRSGSINRNAQCAVAPTANSPPPPSRKSLRGTGHASVTLCQPLEPRDNPMIGMLAKEPIHASNGMVSSAVSHNNQCQAMPLPRAVVVMPSIRKVIEPAQRAPAPAIGPSPHNSQPMGLHPANQPLCSMQARPLHPPSMNRSHDVEAAPIHPPAGGSVRPSNAQQPSQLAENPNHVIGLVDVTEDHTARKKMPLGCRGEESYRGEHHSRVPHVVPQSKANRLDATYRDAPEDQSVTWSHSADTKTTFGMPGGQAGSAVAFSCNMFPSAEPSPKPAAPANGMARSANPQQPRPGGRQAAQKGLRVTAEVDIPSAATGRQGRLLKMMQRAKSVLRGQSQCTQSQPMRNNMSPKQPLHSPDVQNPGRTAVAQPHTAAIAHMCDPGHHGQARSQLALNMKPGDAEVGVVSFQQRSFKQMEAEHADATCNSNGHESVLRKAIRAALQKTAGCSHKRSKCDIKSQGRGTRGGVPTSSGSLNAITDHVEGVAQELCEQKPSWEQFTPDAAEEKISQERVAQTACGSAGLWSHSQLICRGTQRQFRQPDTDWQGQVADSLRKDLQSDGVPTLHATHNTGLSQVQCDNQTLNTAEPKAYDRLNTKQLACMPVDQIPGGKPAICTAAILKSLLRKQPLTSPAEVCHGTSVCDAQSAGNGITQSGATRHAEQVSEGTYPSLADGQIKTATSWGCTRMYLPTHLKTVQTSEATSPLFSHDVEFSSMTLPVAVAHESKSRVTGAILIQESRDPEQALTADQCQSSHDQKLESCGQGSELDASKSIPHLPIHKAVSHGGGESSSKQNAQAKNVASHSSTRNLSPCILTPSSLPDAKQNSDIKQAAPVGKSIQSALGRLRQALCRQSKLSTSSTKIANLDSGTEGSDTRTAIQGGDNAATAQDPHILVLRKELDVPICTQWHKADTDCPTSPASGTPQEEAANAARMFGDRGINQLLQGAQVYSIDAAQMLDSSDAGTTPIATPVKPPDSPTPQPVLVPTATIPAPEASGGLHPSQDHPASHVDASPTLQTPPASPPVVLSEIQEIKVHHSEFGGILPHGVSNQASVEAEPTVNTGLSHKVSLPTQNSAHSMVDHNGGDRLPKCRPKPMKRKVAESLGFADVTPQGSSADTQMLLARRPAFKCPRYRK